MRLPYFVCGILMIAVISATAQSLPSPLVMRVTVGEYFSEEYTARPSAPARYVFFEGEAVILRIAVGNDRDETEGLVPMAQVPQDLFVVEVSKEDNLIPMQIAFDEATWKVLPGSGGRLLVALDDPLELGQYESLEWKATLNSQDLSPGAYHITMRIRAADGTSRPVRNQAAPFVFEVRASTSVVMPEILRREADRQFVNQHYAAAREAVAALLLIHPNSALAHLTRSRIAQAEGFSAEWQAEITQARTLLTSGSDALFLQFASPREVQDLLASLPQFGQ